MGYRTPGMDLLSLLSAWVVYLPIPCPVDSAGQGRVGKLLILIIALAFDFVKTYRNIPDRAGKGARLSCGKAAA